MKEPGMDGKSIDVIIEIDSETGEIIGWCATLAELGLMDCPKLHDTNLITGEPFTCDDCYCG